MLPSGGRSGRDERPRPLRERLDAAVSGLGELEFLRQRQEDLVRAALELREAAEEEEERRSSEEKLLEENILLLRRQLNCLRRRDVGLLSQLQELDRQISDLRLDSEASHDLPEADSRPSSGFYELSDAASGSLSNSSNSVFSECFCATIDADGRLPLAGANPDDAPGCSACDGVFGGFWDDSASAATVRRSLSAPHPPPADASSPPLRDPPLREPPPLGGGDAYRYPSPLHAVAAPGPGEAGGDGLKPETPPHVAPSSSWPAASQTPPHKRLDGYIVTLLQRRAAPVRTCRPRTSISTDPSKSALRQASLCSRQVCGPAPGPGSGPGPGPGPGPGTLRASDLHGTMAAAAASSPQRKAEDRRTGCSDSPRGLGARSSTTAAKQEVTSLRRQSKVVPPLAAAPPKGFPERGAAAFSSSPKEAKRRPADQEPLLKPPPQSGTPKAPPRPPRGATMEEAGPVAASTPGEERRSHGVSVRHRVQKDRKLQSAAAPKATRASELVEVRGGEKSRRRANRPRLPEDGRPAHSCKRGVSSGTKRARAPQADPGADGPSGSTPRSVRSAASKHHRHGNHRRRHQHGREPLVVVAKLKHKRDDYQRLRTAAEIPYDEALRRAQRRRRKEPPSDAYAAAAGGRVCSPYAFAAGSESEYSAECASLFHSTILDTSEDETSNYTANRFGDSESGEDAASDTEESGGGGAGGAGRGRGREARMTPARAKACVKIKASHALKRKILRFRSGSLKLMTTV